MRNTFTRKSDLIEHKRYSADGLIGGIDATVEASPSGWVMLSIGPTAFHLKREEAFEVSRVLAEAARVAHPARAPHPQSPLAQIEAHTVRAIRDLSGPDLERPTSHLRTIMDELSLIRDCTREEQPASHAALTALEGIAHKAHDALRQHDRAEALAALFRIHLTLIELRTALEAAQ